MSLESVFELMETHKRDLHITDWAITNTTLEEVFLQISNNTAKEHEVESEKETEKKEKKEHENKSEHSEKGGKQATESEGEHEAQKQGRKSQEEKSTHMLNTPERTHRRSHSGSSGSEKGVSREDTSE